MEIFGISVTNVVLWLVFGFLAGWVVYMIDRRSAGGDFFSTIVLGILGAVVGGYLAGTFFGIDTSGFTTTNFVVAIIGGLILSYLYRLLSRSNFAEMDREANRTSRFASSGVKGGKSRRDRDKEKQDKKGKSGKKGGLSMRSNYLQHQSTLVNPIQIQKYLEGVNYPATKEDLIETAVNKGADKKVLGTLREMPGDSFNSPNDVSEAIGKIE